MGTYYSAAIVVGLPRRDIPETLFDAEGGIGELTIVSPIFDGYNDEDAIVGFILQESGDYKASELDDNKLSAIPSKMKDFFQITGLKPKVWLSPQCN